jgi:16S rRNA (cytosine1402-N4)-methyltransferase
VLLAETLRLFNLLAGQVVVDCTVGWGGHAVELLKAVGPAGKLVGLDLDAENLAVARTRLDAIGYPYDLQVDDPSRGFSYRREGPLDMRLDRSRGKTAAQILATIPEDELARLLHDLADEPRAQAIAQAMVAARQRAPLTTTTQLAQLLLEVAGVRDWRLRPARGVWQSHPAARTFQALRIYVNRELANLEHLLRVLPHVLKPGGVAAIISFHSGEDRLVKAAFRDGLRQGVYAEVAEAPVTATFREKADNPRSRSAKLRWARRSSSTR